MSNIKDIIKNLISADNMLNMSSSEIINEIASNQYNGKNGHLKDPIVFTKLPIVLQDILLLADFDTELNMNGILGFLENSTGLYLNETIEALGRIDAIEDRKIMDDIRSIMMAYGCSPINLRENVNKGYEYEITNFISTHGEEYEEMADKIEKESKRLYYRCPNRNIFDNLEVYVDQHKEELLSSILG
ncbi:DMP19 family protein [Acetivibrio cellulolyticus]|uniref:DMP19 family protein n=1 Tax=Acetivibrio cellulolyticus TaxID=35830 RepID=UPI0001E2D19E|nr:DUF4375 domain-containing protein [Acetivibrio cellulolyticus]